MRRPAAARSPDLLVTAGLALVGLIATALPAPTWLSVALLLPLVLALPGYALCAALFPPGSLPPAERAIYALALSVSATGLTGVAVQLAIPLGGMVWAGSLLAVTIGACAVAERRRADRARWGRPGRLAVRGPGLPALAMIALAVAICGWAFSVAVEGAREDRDSARFTELWALPQPDGAATEGTAVAIGVSNHQGNPVEYRVRASHGRTTLREWTIRLPDGGHWRGSLAPSQLTPAEPLRVTLLHGTRVVRRVFLRSELTP